MQHTAIIGGGLAGAAVAWFLTREGRGPVTLFEREPLCGTHSSGRNAAMLRASVPCDVLAALCREGARFLHQPPFPVEVRRTGSLFLADAHDWPALQAEAARSARLGIACRPLTPREAIARVPALEGARFAGAIHTPGDGVVDVAGLLEGFLRGAREAGLEQKTGCAVRDIVREAGRVLGVESDDGFLPAATVVDAAGPWASPVAARAGLETPLQPLRRHLYVTELDAEVDPDAPYVWDVSAGYYFRPESGGLLLCCCDEDARPPGTPEVDPDVELLLAEKLERAVPSLASRAIRRSWAGLRTFAADRSFVLGPDPRLEGFVWAAALGGHGVTCSPAVGRLVVESLRTPEVVGSFGVERLLG